MNGRNALTWDEKFALDAWYVDHASFSLDVRILFRTLAAPFTKRGISAAGEATMPEFTGSGRNATAEVPRDGAVSER